MKKIWSGKALTAAIAGAVILALAFVIVQCLPYFMSDFSADKRNVMLSGKYSVDGGEWKSIGPETEIRDHFHKITVRGKTDELAAAFEIMAISSKDVWYTLKTDDGAFELHNRRTAPDIPEENFLPENRMPCPPKPAKRI